VSPRSMSPEGLARLRAFSARSAVPLRFFRVELSDRGAPEAA